MRGSAADQTRVWTIALTVNDFVEGKTSIVTAEDSACSTRQTGNLRFDHVFEVLLPLLPAKIWILRHILYNISLPYE